MILKQSIINSIIYVKFIEQGRINMGVTIKDVAKQAGVSIATVSHVINKTRYVSPELVKK